MRLIITFLFFIVIFGSCKKENTLFELVNNSGIDFANTITEKDTLNILDTEFVYNGGGVGIGDLNGDGLQDVYFTGNQVPNKLYLNKGNLKFEDVTEVSHTQKYAKQWSAGISILDINLDGKLDIYVCNMLQPDPELRRNLLFINQGNNKDGVPIFKEMAKEYNVEVKAHSANANFFDYDNDGDMDLFIATNFIDTKYPNQAMRQSSDGSSLTRDILLENTWDSTLNHPVFTDISIKAGIVYAGYSHSTLVRDFNDDGWQDIYVANDYATNDLLYINEKGNGSTTRHFSNKISQILKHQPSSAMGSDFGDINNDGLMDMFTTEMLPYENKRKKLFLNATNYNAYINNENYHYDYQYQRNMLQLNRGVNSETKLPVFSEISLLANVQETDWSWTPLFIDFDNDGYRDLLVTNGFPKDVTDHDFGAFRSMNNNLVSKKELYEMIPSVKVPNFLFKNKGDLSFEDVSKTWGSTQASFSNGAAYADLDNDGDVDYIVNNIDDKAFVYKNTLQDNAKKEANTSNYLRIKLIGSDKNPDAFHSKVKIFYANKVQVGEETSARGYMSKSEGIIHFGLGSTTKIDSILVVWADGKSQKLANVKANQVITVSYKNSLTSQLNSVKNAPIFDEINPKSIGLDYLHTDDDYIDFNVQRTLPHKFSQYGPAIAIGDVNGDKLDDMVLGASSKYDETIFLQQKNGKFIKKTLNFKPHQDKKEEDLGILLFDADNDGDNDIYLARGSGQHLAGSNYYQHLLCINDGKGNFKIDSLALGNIHTNASPVKAVDFDNDGDLDLFIGGRVLPKNYPKTDRSYLLRNDSPPAPDGGVNKNGKSPHRGLGGFTDVTQQLCPELATIGMVSDAIWSDFNNDNRTDLILAGEWMPLTFMQNTGNGFKNVSSSTGIGDKIGWWNSITAGDFDNDGDIDYVAGNFGQNIYFKCNSNEPITIYAKDFDGNGLYDPFISCFWRDSTEQKHEYFFNTRDDMMKQLILIRKKFMTYADFGKAQVKDVFTKEELKDAQIMKANYMSSAFIENLGNGKFKISELPMQAQIAPIFGMLPYDYDHDGLLDLMLVGNDYGMELLQGRADAFYGLVLKNMGKNQFKTIELNQSNFFVPKDARGLTRIGVGGRELIVATQNRDSLKVFAPKLSPNKQISLNADEVKAQIILKNGQKRSKEFYYGTSFGSQEPRSMSIDPSIKSVVLFNRQNKITRTVE